jgi:hypothetical protein
LTLYEWHAKPCLGWPEQHEIGRIIIGNRLVFALHYAAKMPQDAAKMPQVPEKTRSQWINKFSQAVILGNH